MRFHPLTANTADYLPGSNNFPYGAPPKLEDNEMDYGEEGGDDVPSGSLSTLCPTPSGKAPLF